MQEKVDVHKIFADYFTGCEALAYALSSRLAEGNMCIDIEEYISGEEVTSENPFFTTGDEFRKQSEEGEFVTYDTAKCKPFIIHRGKAYLQRYFRYESEIIGNIRRLGNNFNIITGGPGSGKTFSVSEKLTEMFKANINLKVALAAPTGKAAARMNESIKDFPMKSGREISENIKEKLAGLSASTLHRLLGTKPGSVFFKFNETNRLPYDVVLVDECSMVDGALMAKLLNAVADDTVIYLIGDKDQLASVEAGSVFGDICRARESKLLKGRIELKTESHRFSREKGIGKFSRQVIDGELDNLSIYGNDNELVIDTGYSKELFEENALLFQDFIKTENVKVALKLLNKVRFLCVTRENDKSVEEYNKKIQNLLAGRTEGFKPKSDGFYNNQPIIITKNDYKLGIFNGDVGLIREKKSERGKVFMAYFETSSNELKEIQAGFLTHYETVFAMTIHKSQGSEFENVVVVLPQKQGKKLLTRELLYTGVTRAVKKAVIQAEAEVIKECVAKQVRRASGLEERLINEKNPE